MSFGLAMSLSDLARRLKEEGRDKDAEVIQAAMHEMDMLDSRKAERSKLKS